MALPFLKGSNKGKGFAPVERVRELMGRGFSEVEVIDILRKDGYSPEEIDNGLTQALKTGATSDQPRQAFEPRPRPQEPMLPTLEEITAGTQQRTPQMPQIPETSVPQEYYQNQDYHTEEYIDYVVQARMGEINQKITEFSVKTGEMSKRVEEVNDRINELMNLRNAEQTQILSKIESFKEDVEGIDTRIASMERAFKETLPILIESVRALTDLVQRLKREA